MKENINLVVKLLKMLGINVPYHIIKENLEEHPDFPSLLSISDVLSDLDIDNTGYQLSLSEFTQIRLPFIVHTTSNKFFIVKKITSDQIECIEPDLKVHKMTIADFSDIYSGFALVIDAVPEIIRKKDSYINSIDAQKFLVFLGSLGLITVLFYFLYFHSSYFRNFNQTTGLLTLILVAGVGVSILLFIETAGYENAFIRKICTGKDANCKIILTSKASKIFGDYLTWSDVGFIYYVGSLLTLLFRATDTDVLSALTVVNILALPYTFFSIYYQKFVSRHWCVLCVSVQILLWLEFFALLPNTLHNFIFPSFYSWLNVMVYLALPLFSLMLIKPLLLDAKKLPPLKNSLGKFKGDVKLFYTLLKDQQKHKLLPFEDTIIKEYNKEFVVTIVTNPNCSFCGEGHQQLEEWQERYKSFTLQVAFSVNDDKTEEIVSYFLGINNYYGYDIAKSGMSLWYFKKDEFEKFVEQYPVHSEMRNNLSSHRQWCDLIQLKHTPSILINGYELPEHYEIKDLKYYLPRNEHQ